MATRTARSRKDLPVEQTAEHVERVVAPALADQNIGDLTGERGRVSVAVYMGELVG